MLALASCLCSYTPVLDKLLYTMTRSLWLRTYLELRDTRLGCARTARNTRAGSACTG